MITISATRARMSAYSTIPWPDWTFSKRLIVGGSLLSAADVVAAHGRRHVGIQVDDLPACRDQRDQHDQCNQGEDERVLNHALPGLNAEETHQSPRSLTIEAGRLV